MINFNFDIAFSVWNETWLFTSLNFNLSTASSEVITTFIGALIMIYALSDIIDMFMFKKHINDVIKSFKKNIKVSYKMANTRRRI